MKEKKFKLNISITISFFKKDVGIQKGMGCNMTKVELLLIFYKVFFD